MFTDFDYPFGIFKLIYILFGLNMWLIMVVLRRKVDEADLLMVDNLNVPLE
jgi:type IV secretory pathway TrbD component